MRLGGLAMGLAKLGNYIVQSDARNFDGIYGEDAVVGLSTQKQMILTKADLDGVNLVSYKLFPPHYFAYVPDTSRRGDKMSLAYKFYRKCLFWCRPWRLTWWETACGTPWIPV